MNELQGINSQALKMPAAAEVKGASKFIAQVEAAKLLDGISGAQEDSQFITEVAAKSLETTKANQPGLRHTIEKWTVPPVVGAAAAAVPGFLGYHFGLPVTKFVANLCWDVTASVASRYPIATAAVGLGTAGFAALAVYNEPDPTEVAAEACWGTVQAVTVATLGTMYLAGSWAMNNVKGGYDEVEKGYNRLKEQETEKIVESLESVYAKMGDELAARFKKAFNDPAALEQLKYDATDLQEKLGQAAQVFTKCGLKKRDISDILAPMKRAINEIQNAKLELRSGLSQTDNQYNAQLLELLSNDADIALSERAKGELRAAQNSHLPFYHEAAGYAKGLMIGALSTVGVAGLLSGVLAAAGATLSPLTTAGATAVGLLVGSSQNVREITKAANERAKSNQAVASHTQAAETELKQVYDGVASFLASRQAQANNDQKRLRLMQQAEKIKEKMAPIAQAIRTEAGLDAEKILTPLNKRLAEILAVNSMQAAPIVAVTG